MVKQGGLQIPMPNEIMINQDYDNDKAMNLKDNFDGLMATDKSVGDEQ